jgi:DNA mismatch repair ATPase MutS
LTLNRATARDLPRFAQSIEAIPGLKGELEAFGATLISALRDGLDELADLRETDFPAIANDPPATASEAGMIREASIPSLTSYAVWR